MAGWLEGGRIHGHRFLPNGLLLAVSLIFMVIFGNFSTTFAQTGFLNVDCGYIAGEYNDSINLKWISDDSIILTGSTATSENPGEGQQLQTFRYFPEPRSKFCYELHTKPQLPYLFRASFYLNESVFQQRRPFQFNLYINATNWFTLVDGDADETELRATQEAIFYSTGTLMNFCLVPGIGQPFISSLQLRELDVNMYSYGGSQKQYLALLSRYNTGAQPSSLPLRFPDDTFDRIWQPLNDSFPIISGPTSFDNTTGATVNRVPAKVMQDAFLLKDSNDTLYTDLYRYDPQAYLVPGEDNVFALVYTELLDSTDSRTYSLNVSLAGVLGPVDSFSTQPSVQAIPNLPAQLNDLTVTLSLAANLTDGPTVNALEVFGQYTFNYSTTKHDDVDGVSALRSNLSLNDWQGDPCTPVPHNWLSCTLDIPVLRNPEGCGLNVTEVEKCLIVPSYQSTYSVNTLTFSNLSSQVLQLFIGVVATNKNEFWLKHLTELSVTNSGLDSANFQPFITYALRTLPIDKLNLSYNQIDDVGLDWGRTGNVSSLNMSHNLLSTVVNSAGYTPFSSNLLELDLSYNLISSLPTSWLSNVTSLLFLDLSHNRLQGSLTPLEDLGRNNNASLAELRISDNNLSGPFNSYFFTSLHYTIGILDRNSITGLDLNAWYQYLLELQNDTIEAAGSRQNQQKLISFLNNSISTIIVDSQAYSLTTDLLSKNQQVILLGGNPVCNKQNTVLELYLCRFDSTDTTYMNGVSKKNHSYTLIVGIIGGIIAILLCCIIVATLWKMCRQGHALRDIQQALVNQKVQPPFYQYSDLKLATRNFHKDNKLGQGGFGVVYKGVLPDGTALAVKKLFNSLNLSVLHEFLNEVVIISGIKHKNLVQMKGCCIKDKDRILVYEYVENGNLAQALYGSKPYGSLNWEERLNICIGVARGVSYLHEELQPSIIHRDIKPENILLDKNFDPKIGDFGLARHFTDDSSQFTKVAGTMGYFSPEYAIEGRLSNKADVYSYGIVVLEILTGRKCIDRTLPMDARFLRDYVWRMHKKGLSMHILDPEIKRACDEAEVVKTINIGLQCVQHNPNRRPSMLQVVTMLLGGQNVEEPKDDEELRLPQSSYTEENSDNSDTYNPELQTVVEEDSNIFSSKSESSSDRNRSKPKSLVELQNFTAG